MKFKLLTVYHSMLTDTNGEEVQVIKRLSTLNGA